MKVVHVIERCHPGGAEIFVRDLLEQLNKLDLETELWVFYRAEVLAGNDQKFKTAEKEYVEMVEAKGTKVYFVDKRPGKGYLKTWRTIRKLYKKSKPDIVHTHLEQTSFNTSMALLGSGAKVVQTVHNTVLHKPILMKCFFKYVNKKLISISKNCHSMLLNLGLKNKVELITNGINIEKFKFDRVVAPEVKQILAVGRLVEQKNHAMLIKAFSQVVKRLEENNIPIPKLLIAGEGELRPMLTGLVKELGLENYVSLPGNCPNIPELLKESDIYVMSSNYEGMSISLIEAVASAIPIICTNVGGSEDALIHNITGTIVEVGNQDAFADALYSLISDYSLRRKYSENCYKNADKFSLLKCAEKYKELYESL